MKVNDVTYHTESSPITFEVSTAECVVVLKVFPVQTYNVKALIGKTLHLNRLFHVQTTTFSLLFGKVIKVSSERLSLRCRQHIAYLARSTVSFSSCRTISIQGSNNRHRSV